jgi:hypothetical protein
VRGIFQSFADAPGLQTKHGDYSVFREEMHEIAYSFGIEYIFRDLFGLRTGYFNEHSTKGNRKYFTFGLGGRFSSITLDLSYLISPEGQNSPLANTFRITFTSAFGRIPKES